MRIDGEDAFDDYTVEVEGKSAHANSVVGRFKEATGRCRRRSKCSVSNLFWPVVNEKKRRKSTVRFQNAPLCQNIFEVLYRVSNNNCFNWQ
jgi:hypothetical protein